MVPTEIAYPCLIKTVTSIPLINFTIMTFLGFTKSLSDFGVLALILSVWTINSLVLVVRFQIPLVYVDLLVMCWFVCLFGLILYVPVNIFFSYVGTGLPGLTSTMSCSKTQRSDEHATPRSRDKHSTTEPLRSHIYVEMTKTVHIYHVYTFSNLSPI